MAGHFTSRCLMNWLRLPLYAVYNKLMMWSVAVQGETDNGPWGPPQPPCNAR